MGTVGKQAATETRMADGMLSMDGEEIGSDDGAAEPEMSAELIEQLDSLWQKRTKRRGTLQDDLDKTKQMLNQLEGKASETQAVEMKVTDTVRRASVIADPARVEAAVADLNATTA